MAQLVKQYKTSVAVRETALALVSGLEPKDWSAEARALFDFVRDDIRFVRDIHDVETLQTPDKTLEYGQGDCDDKATLLATLLAAIGHPSRFHAIGFERDVFMHVYVETLIGDKWIALDPTEPYEIGWHPQNVIASMIYYA